MNRQERKKQQKKKERQERLRQEKQARTAPLVPPPAAAPLQTRVVTPSARATPAPAPSPVPPSLLTAVPGSVGPAGHIPAPTHADGDGTAELPEAALDNFFVGEPARKWLDALLADTDLGPIVRTLDPADALPAELMLRASVCSEILVAAEMVAAGIGRPSRHLPANAAAWLRARDALYSPGVVRLAAAAVHRVGDFSELRQLWEAVHLAQEWMWAVAGLYGRLLW